MSAILIDGKKLALTITDQVLQEVTELAAAGRAPRLATILAGEDKSSLLYAEHQKKRAGELGIQYELVRVSLEAPGGSLEERLLAEIQRLNRDTGITGIMLQQPLPAGVDAIRVQLAIDPAKDVEGVNPASLGLLYYDRSNLLPCTALAALECLKSTGVAMRGAEAVVVGQSAIVGKPVAALLVREKATVTCCRSATKNLGDHTRRADILVVAVGQPGMITADMVKPGAVVIDVGTNRVAGADGKMKTVGDCAPAVAEVAGQFTPVPGGVGPLTVAILMRNTVLAARRQWNRD